MDYSRVSTDDSSDSEINGQEEKSLLDPIKERIGQIPQSRWIFSAKILTILNVCFTAGLILATVHLKRNLGCIPGPQPPWSPVRNDGVIRNINKWYKPEKIFQSETTPEVEEAWESWLDEHDRLLILPIEETKTRLPITVDAFLDPGYAVYGLAVYHQMHCLNHIRKTFHVEQFFPNTSREMVLFHKNHCFDMLRQAIMCHADIAIMHWWNDTYSVVGEDGVVHLTEHYKSLTPSQQAEGAFAKWDTPVQCRDLEAINAWTMAHSMENDKYAATVGQIKRRSL